MDKRIAAEIRRGGVFLKGVELLLDFASRSHD